MKMRKIVTLFALTLTLGLTTLTGCGAAKGEEENHKQESTLEESKSDEAVSEESKEETTSEESKDENGSVENKEEGKTEGENQGSEATTAGDALYAAFQNEIKNNQNLEEVAAILLTNEVINKEMATMVMPVEEGWLAGFDEEVTGFNEGVTFSPVIGTIPFVGYLFQSDTPDQLVEFLSEKANLNWNICTSAEQMVVGAADGYVFFVMCPKNMNN